MESASPFLPPVAIAAVLAVFALTFVVRRLLGGDIARNAQTGTPRSASQLMLVILAGIGVFVAVAVRYVAKRERRGPESAFTNGIVDAVADSVSGGNAIGGDAAGGASLAIAVAAGAIVIVLFAVVLMRSHNESR